MTSLAQVAETMQHVLTTMAEAAARATGCVRRRRVLDGARWVQALVAGCLGTPRPSLEALAQSAAALGPAETRAVEEVIAGLRDRGFAVLIISHNLEQVFRLVDRVWVMRRGRMIGERWLADSSPEEIVALITGAATVERWSGGAA